MHHSDHNSQLRIHWWLPHIQEGKSQIFCIAFKSLHKTVPGYVSAKSLPVNHIRFEVLLFSNHMSNARFRILLTKVLFSVQFSSVTHSCLTLCDPMNHSTPGLPVHYQLPEFTQTHVHRVGDAIQPSHPLSSPSPPAPNPSQHQGGKNTQENCTKKSFTTQIIMMVLSLTQSQTSWNVKSNGPQKASLRTKLVEVMEFQWSYFKS